jgi:hypothetical protein
MNSGNVRMDDGSNGDGGRSERGPGRPPLPTGGAGAHWLESGAVAVAVVASAGFLLLYATNLPLLVRLTAEDGWVEWAEAVAFLASAGGFAYLAVRRYRSRFACAGLALMCFLVTGEEISWGQRLFRYRTPGVLRRANQQREFNLHNLRGVHGSQRLASIVVIFGLSLLVPLVFRHVPALRDRLLRIDFPVFPLWSNAVFVLGLAWMLVPRAFLTLSPSGGFAGDEIGELLFAIGFLASTAWLILTSRRSRPALAPAARPG